MADEQKLEKTSELSIQARVRGEVTGLPVVLPWLTIAGQLISPWWSQFRDKQLRDFWKKPDHLAGAVYTFQSRISTIPLHVEPRDFSIRAHMRQADQFTEMLLEDSEAGAGWNMMIEPGMEDWLGTDNGIFLEAIGDGEPDGPIQGPVQMVNHLDSGQCRRTSDPEFPVTYMDPDDGKIYKLHRSRVIFASQMPSASTRMNKVGFCAVSRCINVAQNIYDILVYKQEKLGSRPPRSVWITKGRLSPAIVQSAFIQASETMNNQRLSRFSKIVVMGSADAPDAEIQELDLASLPDGFDEQTSITLGMATISLAFGVDARELFPGLTAGATRAEALVSHLKQRGKGYGQTLQMLIRQFNQKVIPPHLKLVFDYQDDAEDMQVAEIRNKRADTRVKNLKESMVTDERTERENMVKDGDITQAQFVRLELDDGRLEDGADVLTLFTNKEFRTVLDLGVENPFDVVANDKQQIMELIDEKRAFLLNLLGEATNVRVRKEFDQALAALDALKELYEESKPEPEAPAQITEGAPEGGETMPNAEPDQGLVVDSDDLDLDADKALEQKGIVQRIGERIRGGSKNAYEEMGNMDSDELYYALMLNERRKAKALSANNAKAVESLVDALQEMASQPTEIIVDIPEIKVPEIIVPATIVNVEQSEIPAPIVNIEPSKDTNNVLEAIKSLGDGMRSLIVELRKSTKQKPPKVEVTVESELSMPDHELEIEKVVERDSLNRIQRTIATRKITKK